MQEVQERGAGLQNTFERGAPFLLLMLRSHLLCVGPYVHSACCFFAPFTNILTYFLT